MMEATPNIPLTCNMAAFNTEQGERHQILFQQIFESIKEIQNLLDGYAFRLPMESSLCVAVAEFITLERLCCPFLNFVLEVEPGDGPLWLKLTGPDGVKQVLRAELGLQEKI